MSKKTKQQAKEKLAMVRAVKTKLRNRDRLNRLKTRKDREAEAKLVFDKPEPGA